MGDTTGRLPRVRAADGPRAFAVIGEAVWWVTIVDATLVRHHPDIYDNVMASQAPAQRRLVEGTLTGLRFVRNRIGDEADLGEFIEAGGAGPDGRQRRITSWTWKPLPDPALGSLPPPGDTAPADAMIARQTTLRKPGGHLIGNLGAPCSSHERMLVVACCRPGVPSGHG